MKHSNLVILAAGASSRMKNSLLSRDTPANVKHLSKALIGIGSFNKPIIDYQISLAKKSGFTDVYLVVGKNYDAFKSIFGYQLTNNDYHGLKIHYAIQHIPKNRIKPMGTSDALLQALDQHSSLRDGTFTVCNSDNLYSENVLKALLNDNNLNAMIRYDRDGLEFSSEKIARFAILYMDDDGFLTNIIEKPDSLDSKKKLWVSMNIFKFNGPSIHPYLKHCPINIERDEKELPTALLNMCHDQEHAMFTIPFSEHVPDLTQINDIEKMNDYLNDK